jgi:hypothetical protein
MKRQKFLLLTLLALFVASSAFGQDMIVKRDAEEIEAKVVKVTDIHIKYRRFSNPAGPVYNVAKAEVLMIKYENGEKDVFTAPTTPTTAPQASLSGFGTTTSVPAGVMTTSNGWLYMGGQRIPFRQAKEYARPFAEATKHLKRARGYNAGGWISSSIGGICLGMGIVGLVSPHDNLYGVSSGGGIALVTVGAAGFGGIFIFDGLMKKEYEKATAAYNSATGLVENYPGYDITLALTPTPGGFGLQLTF